MSRKEFYSGTAKKSVSLIWHVFIICKNGAAQTKQLAIVK